MKDRILTKLSRKSWIVFFLILMGFICFFMGIGNFYLYNLSPARGQVSSIRAPIKVSIIIPVYNTEPYLKRCLDSAINQTLKDIEIICVNDGSTDNSLGILQEYAQKDKRIKVINHEKNKGVAAARNTAIRAAKGEFVGFLDSDDFIDEKFFENLYNNSDNFDLVKGLHLGNGKLLEDRYAAIFGSIVRRQFLLDKKLEFPPLKRGEDTKFYKNIKKSKARIRLLDDNGVYYHYERRLGSLTNYSLKRLKRKYKVEFE